MDHWAAAGFEAPPPDPSWARRAPGALSAEALRGLQDPALSVLSDPDGPAVRAAGLLAARFEAWERERGYRSYLFTSLSPRAGRTTVALNTALGLAQSRARRVALLEADFRAPRLAELIGRPEAPGLSELLAGQVSLAEACLQIDDRPLVLLPAGAAVTNPEACVASPLLKEAALELVDTVDLLLIDAPAVAPHADAQQLLGLADQALIVVAHGQARRGALAAAVAQLGAARVAGVVYNN